MLISSGARSEVDFFSTYPTNFGKATPDSATVISPGSNYVWEDGGSATDPNGGTFTWSELNVNASTNAQAGNGSDGTNQYIILKDTESTLYTPADPDNGANAKFNCIVVYRAQLVNTPATPASSNSTTSGNSSSNSTDPSSGAAQTTSTSPTPTAIPDTGLSTGAKAGIGIGVAAGVIAILAMAGFFWWTRRQRDSTAEPMSVRPNEKTAFIQDPYSAQNGREKGFVASELPHEPAAQEMGGQQVSEMNAVQERHISPVEMDGSHSFR